MVRPGRCCKHRVRAACIWGFNQMNPMIFLPLLQALMSGASQRPSVPTAEPSQAASPQAIDLAGIAALITAAQQQPSIPSPDVKMPWAAGFISAVITLGFFALMGAISWLLILGQQPNAALFVGFGALLSWVTVIVSFYLGSSFGSRTKDARRQEAPGSSIILPAPTTPSEPVTPAPEPAPGETGLSGRSLTFKGKVSHFGGPDDQGVAPDEGVALIEPNRLDQYPAIKALFLPDQPVGTTGLARRLDPSKAYIACRWDYTVTPKPWLRTIEVECRANGKSVKARPIDWGPGASTGRIADVSPAVMAALGLATDDEIEIAVPMPDSGQPPETGPGGPDWLARAIALLGLYERPGAADNPAILDMARICGGQIAATYKHDAIAWCALFVNYCLVASGHAGNDSLWALDFANYGRKLSGPAVGAIACKRREGGGHVFIVRGRDSAGRLVGIGGNQSDMVCDEEFDSEAIVSYNWPEDAALPSAVGASMTDVSALPHIIPAQRERRDVALPA